MMFNKITTLHNNEQCISYCHIDKYDTYIKELQANRHTILSSIEVPSIDLEWVEPPVKFSGWRYS